MTEANRPSPAANADQSGGIIARFLAGTELDRRMLGMLGALALIWIAFHVYSYISTGAGLFITPRNLWNLSVQTASIGIMATGMVLVIVTRNIDLSVGSLIGVIGMIMGVLQVDFLPDAIGLGNPATWVITTAVGLLLGAILGAFHGWLIAYRGIPSFIVTLGGMLVWRGAAFLVADGKTVAPVDATFALLGGGPYGAVGSTGSWIVGILGCIAIIWAIYSGRSARIKHQIKLRPIWGDVFVTLLGCGALIGAVLVVDAYPWPKGIVKDYAAANGLTLDPETTFISHGFAIPVLIMAGVAIAMTILMTRTRFGRYVFAIGGNPEAASLAGIDTRWMTVKIFSLMGLLAGISAVISSARLNSATNALGTLDELYVIAAAVIGGTSLAGGIGTIYGAIIGAFIMASLQTGMVLIGFGDGSYRSIVVGTALVFAVYLDNLYNKAVK